MENTKRINLLSNAEVSDLYCRPDFTSYEQELYFDLSSEELVVLDNYSNARTCIYFILQLGYFKAKQQFFKFDFNGAACDVAYLKKKYFPNTNLKFDDSITRKIIGKQIKDILTISGYKNWNVEFTNTIIEQINKLIRYHPQSHSALRQLLSYFEHQKIVIPTYRTFQDMFTIGYSQEGKRLDLLMQDVPKKMQNQLANLLVTSDGINRFNELRSDQKNFKYTAIRSEVNKARELNSLYLFSKGFIPNLMLSKNAIGYYSEIASNYAAYRLKRLNKTKQWLHII